MKMQVPTRQQCQTVRLWRNDITMMLSHRTPYQLTDGMQDEFYDNVINNRNSPHRYWSIFEDDKFIAFGGITNIQWENGIGEISLIVRPDEEGKGLGEKSVELLLEQAFKRLGLKTVCGECYLSNEKRTHFWQKITDKYKGYATTLPCRKFWDGVYFAALYFSIDKADYFDIEQIE